MKAIKDLIKWLFFMDDDSLAKEGTKDDPLQNAIKFGILLGLFFIPYFIYMGWGSIRAYFLELF